MQHPILIWIALLAAAVLEVAGDATVRRGLRGSGSAVIVIGCVALGAYYVAVFATVSVLAGRLVFRESVPLTTWLGIAIIVVGGLVIQLGPSLKS